MKNVKLDINVSSSFLWKTKMWILNKKVLDIGLAEQI